MAAAQVAVEEGNYTRVASGVVRVAVPGPANAGASGRAAGDAGARAETAAV